MVATSGPWRCYCDRGLTFLLLSLFPLFPSAFPPHPLVPFAVFGNVCSPIADNTVLAALAAKCDINTHVRSQACLSICSGVGGGGGCVLVVVVKAWVVVVNACVVLHIRQSPRRVSLNSNRRCVPMCSERSRTHATALIPPPARATNESSRSTLGLLAVCRWSSGRFRLAWGGTRPGLPCCCRWPSLPPCSCFLARGRTRWATTPRRGEQAVANGAPATAPTDLASTTLEQPPPPFDLA